MDIGPVFTFLIVGFALFVFSACCVIERAPDLWLTMADIEHDLREEARQSEILS